MRKNGMGRNKRALESAVSELIARELEAVSDALYAEMMCERDYPELAELFERFSREHSANMKRLERALTAVGDGHTISVRANARLPLENDLPSLITSLLSSEREDALKYERLYLADSDGVLGKDIKEILRASRERLSIFETILKT